MQKEDVFQHVLQSPHLPTLPTVASQLITLTAREDVVLSDIANLISKDISLSAKILKVANSAFYSFPQQISSITQAVSILGTNAVRSLVLSFSFLSMKGEKHAYFDFKKFWQQSLATAIASQLILENVKGANTEEVLLSGLLQNLGELVFIMTLPEEYEKVLIEAERTGGNVASIEKQMFSIDHAALGYEVTSSWGFPENLCLPILYHHSPLEYDGKNENIRQTIAAIYLSTVLTHIFTADNPQIHYKKFRTQAASLLKISPPNIEKILASVHIKIQEASSYFDFKLDPVTSIHDILQEANIRLSLINLDYDQINKELIQTKIALEKITEELQAKNKKLENLANIDGLTNVYNHRYFQNTLDQEINRSIRRDLPLSLVMLDIDFFKHFNDSFGHQAGDFILSELTNVIAESLREYDTLARYGGEEFAVILPESEADGAATVCEKIRLGIEEHPFDDGKESYKIKVSIGFTSTRPATDDAFNKSDFIGEADIALYDAKKKGRNRVSQYTAKKKGWFG